jgi:PAS domain S-box-containing protein
MVGVRFPGFRLPAWFALRRVLIGSLLVEAAFGTLALIHDLPVNLGLAAFSVGGLSMAYLGLRRGMVDKKAMGRAVMLVCPMMLLGHSLASGWSYTFLAWLVPVGLWGLTAEKDNRWVGLGALMLLVAVVSDHLLAPVPATAEPQAYWIASAALAGLGGLIVLLGYRGRLIRWQIALLEHEREERTRYRRYLIDLGKKERKTRRILENALVAVLEISDEGRMLYANPRARELMGLGDADLGSQRLMACLSLDGERHDNCMKLHGDLLERVRTNGNQPVEAWIIRPNEDRIPVEVALSREGMDDKGSMLFIQDISMRKHQERILQGDLEIEKTINAFSTSLLDQHTEEELLWDLARNCIGSMQFEDCVVYTWDERRKVLVQRAALGAKNPYDDHIDNVIELDLGQGIVGTCALTRRPIRVGNTREDERYVEDDQFRLSELAVPILLGKELLGVIDSEHPKENYYTARHQRILETVASMAANRIAFLRHQAAKASEMLEQKRFYEDILNNIPADIAVFDEEHRYIYVNPVALRNEQIRHWLIGKTDFDYCALKGIDTKLAEARRERFRRVMDGQRNEEFESEHVHPETGERTVVLRQFHPYTSEAQRRFVIGYGIDITRIKEAEQVIRDHNVTLQFEVRRQTADLQRTNEELQRSNEDLEHFAYMASHDLQEPLRSITSFLQLLVRRYGEGLEKDAMEYIRYAIDGSTRMSGLVKGLLEYSRLSRQEVRGGSVPTGELFDAIRHDLSTMLEERQGTLVIRSMPDELPGDPDLLRMVFYNLVNNGLKYNDKPNPRVRVDGEELEREIHIRVRDNGLGIPEEEGARIFDLFSRVDHGEEYRGTGIGLASCRKIVERHGGRIWYDSEPGEGTTFTVSLPKPEPESLSLNLRPEPAAQPEPAPSVQGPARRRIPVKARALTERRGTRIA